MKGVIVNGNGEINRYFKSKRELRHWLKVTLFLNNNGTGYEKKLQQKVKELDGYTFDYMD